MKQRRVLQFVVVVIAIAIAMASDGSGEVQRQTNRVYSSANAVMNVVITYWYKCRISEYHH